MLGLVVTLPALAADPGTNIVSAATLSKTQIQPADVSNNEYKLEIKKKAADNQSTNTRLEGLSCQAWTTIATRRSDGSSFFDGRDCESKLSLCSFGHEPW